MGVMAVVVEFFFALGFAFGMGIDYNGGGWF